MFFSIKLIFVLIIIHMSLFANNNLKKVTLQLSWFDQFQFAGYYIAKEKGFYEKLGLDVEIKPFEFGLDIPKDVSSNKIDFAIGRESLILDKLNDNRKIKVLYALFQSSPLILLTKKDSKINSINDFESKTIMATLHDANEVSLNAMIKSHNVDLKDLSFLQHSHNIDDLINNKTDIISAYISKAPFDLQNKGISYNLFEPKTYGFDMYSDFLFTSDNLILNDIKTVKAFKKASLMGWEYAYRNIPESVDLILNKYNTQKLSKDALVFEAKELKKISYFNTNALGKIEKSKFQRIYDLYKVMGLINNNNKFDSFIFKENNSSLKLLKKKGFFTKSEKDYLENKKFLKYCTIPNLMPYSKIDKESNAKGFSVDFLKFLSNKSGIDFKLVVTQNWRESLEKISSRQCDILPIAVNLKSRLNKMNFTLPYIDQPLVVATKNKEAFINEISDIANKKVGVFKDSAIIDLLKTKYPSLNVVEVDSPMDGLKKVNDNELFGYIDSLISISYNIKRTSFYNLKIAGKLEITFPFSIASRNDEPLLTSILQKILNTVSKEEKNILLNDWMSVKFEEEINYIVLFRVIAFFAFILCIFLLFLYKQNKLKNEIVELNRTLEQRVKDEVEKNRNKDITLFRQSKLASMGEMIGNIAHQWRQPLNRINLNLSVITMICESNKIDKNMIFDKVDDAEKNIKYMSHTLDDFTNFFRPDKKKNVFNVIKIVNRCIKLLEGRTLDIELDIPKNCNIKVENFKNEFLQVVLIILNNAIDNFKITNVKNQIISINLLEDENSVILSIKDNSGGMPAEILEKIFEPYFTTKFKKEGTGIGLYMAKMIIEKSMDGELSVSSIKDTSTFVIRLKKYNNDIK